MKNRRLAIVSALFLFAASAFAQNDLQPLAVVKLNRSETITLKHLKTRVDFVQKQYGIVLSPEQRAEVLESIISEKLIVQAAAKEGLSITDSQVDQYFLDTFIQQLGVQVTMSELESFILQNTKLSLDEYVRQRTAMSLSEYKAYLKNQLIAQQYVMYKKQAEINAIAPSDAEIRRQFELNSSSFQWNDMVQLFLVIVPKGTDLTASKALANQFRNSYVANPANAESISKDSRNGSAFQAGMIVVEKTAAQAASLGWTEDSIIELFGYPEGFVGELQETATDFQFYAVQKKYSAKFLQLSDVVAPGANVTVYEYIKTLLTQQMLKNYLSTAVFDLSKTLDTASNVERKKSGSDLINLLNW